MYTKARELMTTSFSTIRPDAPVREAVRMIYESRVRDTGYKPFGVMVVDDIGRLVGMISMFDVLYHLRPPFMNYELESLGPWQGELEPFLAQFEHLKVEQVMSAPTAVAAPEDHFMVLIDRMVKRKVRRLPVLENDTIIGIVYLSDVFYHLCETWLKNAPS